MQYETDSSMNSIESTMMRLSLGVRHDQISVHATDYYDLRQFLNGTNSPSFFTIVSFLVSYGLTMVLVIDMKFQPLFSPFLSNSF